jgi:dipeptidyl aminopeptidase/acylaminoacyl peptidase
VSGGPTIAPYGTWASPVAASMIADTAISLAGIHVDGDTLYWLEGRPAEGGRVVLVRQSNGGGIDVTPAPYSVRSRVHEYGGGAVLVSGGDVFFVNFADQRIYRQVAGGVPEAVTADSGDRFADMCHDRARDRLICVRERHTEDGVENALVAVSLVDGAVAELVTGHDFVSNPRLSPDGRWLAWLSWELPDMPWDATSLWVAELDAGGRPGDPVRVAGGEGESVFQPEWRPDGSLVFVSDPTDWWNLYAWDGGNVAALAPLEAEFGLPQWVFGMRTYDIGPNGGIVCAWSQDGRWRLGFLDGTGLVETDVPYDDISGVRVVGGRVAFVAASPRAPAAIVLFDPADGSLEVVRRSFTGDIDPDSVSAPREISFPTTDGAMAHGFHYPPRNADFAGPEAERPPLIVRGHGGPTGATSPSFSLGIQYWTSRGFAVLDVNYRGSTGFGRSYREALYGAWGVADVDDMVAGAEYLVAQGAVDPARLAIRGGSAGGYTTLAALAFRDTFSAGASLYGIGDLMTLARDTHKFESRYLDRLIGPLPEAEAVYRKRSPINHVDGLDCPVIFLQGDEDQVVPPNQAEAMVAALDAKGIPVAYVLFEGEGHGFRKAENVCRALEAELCFYARVFGFAPADALPALDIRNLDD